MEDSYLSVIENRKQRRRHIQKINTLHGWLVVGEHEKMYIRNKIYSSFSDNSYKEISAATLEKINPYPSDWEVDYVGLVDEYLGEMIQRPNVVNILLQKLYDEVR
jgi:hypothetical protein